MRCAGLSDLVYCFGMFYWFLHVWWVCWGVSWFGCFAGCVVVSMVVLSGVLLLWILVSLMI